jgi:hypothetical protein
MAEAFRTALLIFPKQSGFQPTVEPTGFQPVVAQLWFSAPTARHAVR